MSTPNTSDKRWSEQSSGKHWPSLYDFVMTYGGIAVILGTVLTIEATTTGTYGGSFVVMLGILMHQIGVWRFASNVSSRRKYLGLREEVDDFIDLVRELNNCAVYGDRKGFEAVKMSMQSSLDRMYVLAGKKGVATRALLTRQAATGEHAQKADVPREAHLPQQAPSAESAADA